MAPGMHKCLYGERHSAVLVLAQVGFSYETLSKLELSVAHAILPLGVLLGGTREVG